MSDVDQLRNALREIDGSLSWFFSCAGAVSRDDMAGMIRDAKKQIDGVRAIVWPPEPAQPEPAPLDNNF